VKEKVPTSMAGQVVGRQNMSEAPCFCYRVRSTVVAILWEIVKTLGCCLDIWWASMIADSSQADSLCFCFEFLDDLCLTLNYGIRTVWLICFCFFDVQKFWVNHWDQRPLYWLTHVNHPNPQKCFDKIFDILFALLVLIC